MIVSNAARLWRLVRYGLHVARGLATIALVFPWIGRERQIDLTQQWARGILRLFGVRLEACGSLPPPRARALFVANHISWLDIALLMAQRPARFVAKSEIRAWPVLGWLAAQAGTLFIERHNRRDVGRINEQVRAVLAEGECVAFFPEGTTSRGDDVLPFKPALLQPAAESHALLWPVAIRYPGPDGHTLPAVPYVDSMGFGESLWAIAGAGEIRAQLIYAPAIDTEGKTRRQIAAEAEQAIRRLVAA